MISSMLDSTTVYQYDGEGRRVAKTNCPSGMSTCTAATPGASTVWYVYDAAGNLAAEYGQSTMAAALPCTTCYLMQDHLGSTRVMTDQNGTAVPGGCHDYLPFGEEIYAPIGQRSTSCYPAGYKPGLLFTGQLRDAWGESQLDYFAARYFSGAQGRFTSPDAPFADQVPADPQSWNLYGYVRNNPLKFVDPTGQYVCAAGVSQEECASFQTSLEQAQAAANRLKDKYGATSKHYTSVQRAIDAYGKAGVDNGVTIKVGNTGRSGAQVEAAGTTVAKTADNPTGQNIAVTFGTGILSGTSLVPSLVAHEGQHVADASAWVASGFSPAMNPLSYQTEFNAYQVQAATGEGLGWRYQTVSFGASAYLLWVQGWPQGNTTAATNAILRREYNLTPGSTRRAYSQSTRVRR